MDDDTVAERSLTPQRPHTKGDGQTHRSSLNNKDMKEELTATADSQSYKATPDAPGSLKKTGDVPTDSTMQVTEKEDERRSTEDALGLSSSRSGMPSPCGEPREIDVGGTLPHSSFQ